MKKWISRFLKGIIPKIVSNRVLLWFFEVLRWFQGNNSKLFKENLKVNLISMPLHLEKILGGSGFIEDQNNYGDMKFGKVSMRHSGCEIIAVFNALHNLIGEHDCSLPELITEFEKDGMVLSGKFGTAPKAIMDYFYRQGYDVSLETREGNFKRLADISDTLILTMYNDKTDITKEVHTVNISKTQGEFCAHNVYCNGLVVGPFDSINKLIESINDGKAKGISLIGIKNKSLDEN